MYKIVEDSWLNPFHNKRIVKKKFCVAWNWLLILFPKIKHRENAFSTKKKYKLNLITNNANSSSGARKIWFDRIQPKTEPVSLYNYGHYCCRLFGHCFTVDFPYSWSQWLSRIHGIHLYSFHFHLHLFFIRKYTFYHGEIIFIFQ